MSRNPKKLFWKMCDADSMSDSLAKRLRRGVCYLLMLFLFPLLGHSQAADIGLWAGAGVEKKINKKFSVNVNVQSRFTDNVSVLKAYLGEVGLSYKLNKHWEVSGYYRYIARRKKNEDKTGYEYRSYHRFYADLAYDRKLWKLKFDYRLRYQNQFQDDESASQNSSSYVRNKFELSYPNKSRFTPYVSTDVFYEIGNGFDQMRNKAGIEILLNKHNKLDFSGFTDYRLTGSQENRFLIGVGYKVKF
ncbi:DUF2490 domain-containing protein [Runella slithyformis]|uniref:DUF2490 domain-containing protein n=1 Tax=Runella slithyformis (strain ATCC 29530 / DSM 19594 / LMG 11500 / NCIMB 11436 / LSU 4) TaxID=761193 RepID=A0A7U3ZJX6_RUNSL|nr:DUF2490 domain-containing protein [Runella slithyformis]AEI48518.1 Protein of unknown function DUF2490 [Runella slithyformis DSM 19594]